MRPTLANLVKVDAVYRVSGTLLAYAILGTVAVGPVKAETLADAIAFAYRTNPTLQSSRYDLRAKDEDVAQAKSELRPTASLEANAGFDRTIYGNAGASANPFGPSAFSTNSDQAQIVVDQALFTSGHAAANRRMAEANVHSGVQTLRGAEGDLLLDLITAYMDVRRYAATVAVWQQSVAELDKIVTEIGARQRAGELTRTDIALGETQLATAREQLVSSETDLESARADYATLVGHEPDSLADEPPLPKLPASIDAAFDAAEQQNPELAATRYSELASAEDIAVTRSTGRPTVNLRGTATVSGKADPFRLRDQDQGFGGSVVLTVPITAGGLVASQIRQAEYRNASDQAKIEATRRATFRNVSNAWNQIANTDRRNALLVSQHNSAATQIDGMLHEYRAGLRSTFDVLYAQQTLRDTDIALLATRRDRYVAQATLLRQTGLLEAGSIMSSAPFDDENKFLHKAERRNALPWDGLIAAIDNTGVPDAHRLTPKEPSASTYKPAIMPANDAAPVKDLVTSIPVQRPALPLIPAKRTPFP